jgi:hypothetical protein
LTAIAGPLPGDPVDYALLPGPQAELLRFGRGCGSSAELFIGGSGQPRLGNGAFAIGLAQGLPSQGALLAIGFDELVGATLPNGCFVNVLPAATAFHVTDGSGTATQPLPVPNSGWLVGLLLFAQWFQDDFGVPFTTSRLLAVRVGT